MSRKKELSDIKCKKCGSGLFVKNGQTRGMQRYKCKACGCQFTASPRRGVDPALKALALVLYAYCGLSMSKIAQICKVSVVAVLKWIKAAALQVKPLTGESSSDIVMIDEVWHFVEGKKKKYGFGAPLMGSRVSLWDGNVVIVVTTP